MKFTFLACSLFLATAIHAQSLIPDSTFNKTGIVTSAAAASSHAGGGIAVQKDGKIVVSGTAYVNGQEDILISRFHSDGQPDLSFNKTGSVIIDGENRDVGSSRPLIDSKGRIIIVCTYNYGDNKSGPEVIRVNADGTPDNSFSKDGQTSIYGFKGDSRCFSGVVLPDDKIIISGLHRYNGSQWQCFVVRIGEDGYEDNSFASKGELFIPVNEIEETSVFTMLQPDGKILIGGNAYIYATKSRQFFVCRLNPNGSKDLTFGKEGKAFIKVAPETDYPNGALLTSEGKIVCFGKYQTQEAGFKGSVARFNADGSADLTFGKGANVVFDFSPNHEMITDVAELPDHGYLMSVQIQNGAGVWEFMLLRLDSNGKMITTFGDKGFYILPMHGQGPTGCFAQKILVQPDGKILVAGTNSITTTTSEILLVRFTSTTLDPAGAGKGAGKVAAGTGNNSTSSPANPMKKRVAPPVVAPQ